MPILHKDIAAIREDYNKYSLSEADVLTNPITQFEVWFKEARHAEVIEPNAMMLATQSENGFPSSRIVLLKDIKPEGFTFFTNYNSKKGESIAHNNRVSLLLFWPELQRQIRIEGLAEKVAESESDQYFASRPKGSRIGAIASPQSQVIQSRENLETAVAAVEASYQHIEEVPRPAGWGGYLVKPVLIEFWQGRSSRLHDRLVYTKTNQNTDAWTINRLAP